MTIISSSQYESLVKEIYSSLISATFVTNDGEEVGLGMGEMGDCREEARRIVDTWMEANGISNEELIVNEATPA